MYRPTLFRRMEGAFDKNILSQRDVKSLYPMSPDGQVKTCR